MSSPPPQDHTPLWLQILLHLTALLFRFSTTLTTYARQVQEAHLEKSEAQSLLSTITASTTFPQFGLLPPELRQQIWADALPRSRVLMLQLPKQPTLLETLTTPHSHLRRSSNVWTCAAPLPSILHVNSESRAVAQRHYTLGLAPSDSQPRIYIDFRRDIIGVSDELMRSPVGRNLWRLTDDLGRAQNLALSSGMAGSFLESRQSRHALASLRHVAVVDSALWSKGVVPRVAAMDWAYWMRWQAARGRAQWCLGGLEEEDGGIGGCYDLEEKAGEII